VQSGERTARTSLGNAGHEWHGNNWNGNGDGKHYHYQLEPAREAPGAVLCSFKDRHTSSPYQYLVSGRCCHWPDMKKPPSGGPRNLPQPQVGGSRGRLEAPTRLSGAAY